MGIILDAIERRDITGADALSDKYYGGAGIIPAPRFSAGMHVDEGTALSISAVYSCVILLAEAISTLPLIVYRRLPSGGKERAKDHPLYWILHNAWNNETTSDIARSAMMAWKLLWGNCYAQIQRANNGNPIALWILPANKTTVQRGRDPRWGADPEVAKGLPPRLWYYVRMGGPGDVYEYPWADIIHIPGFGFDGIKGLSPVSLQRRALGLQVAAEEMGSAFFQNGMWKSGIVEHPAVLSDQARDRIENSIIKPQVGIAAAGKPFVLEEGMKYHELTMPMKDAQFIEIRQFGVIEVCRFFRVPPHKVYEMSRATWGNAEQMQLEWVIDSLRAHLVRWEQVLNMRLFGDINGEYFCEHLIDAQLRGDSQTRTSALERQMKNGILNRDEWREIENRNPVEDGKRFYIDNNIHPVDEPPPPATNQKQAPPDEPGSARRITRERFVEIHSPMFADAADRFNLRISSSDGGGDIKKIAEYARRAFDAPVRGLVAHVFVEYPGSAPIAIPTTLVDELLDAVVAMSFSGSGRELGERITEFAYGECVYALKNAMEETQHGSSE